MHFIQRRILFKEFRRCSAVMDKAGISVYKASDILCQGRIRRIDNILIFTDNVYSERGPRVFIPESGYLHISGR